ncbi:SapB/AmfS family lanthipeptide [Mycoavidus sp. SF9855]|nr:SapB/AmfS family lanthipeptide [Mycoavidus sp. SF9855]UUM21890.1 SapB/AmfS family lanthipeptide [Mycoavidus sp. SF9855]
MQRILDLQELDISTEASLDSEFECNAGGSEISLLICG